MFTAEGTARFGFDDVTERHALQDDLHGARLGIGQPARAPVMGYVKFGSTFTAAKPHGGIVPKNMQ